MKRPFFFPGLFVLGACSGANPDLDNTATSVSELRQSASYSSFQHEFTIDTRGIEERPPSPLPKRRLLSESWNANFTARHLLETDEELQEVRTLRTHTRWSSLSWFLEIDASDGTLMALRRNQTTSGATETNQVPSPINELSPPEERKLTEASLARLQRWGIEPGEVGRILQRQLLKQDETNTHGVQEPKLHRYKTFVLRGFHGIAVDGHRAVLTYTPDGNFHRAYARWPALADTGHRLSTKLTTAEIVERTVAQLRAEGESEGLVQLSWKYVPRLAHGRATLELVASARTDAHTVHGTTEEPRVLDVSVDAF